jgi:hypothetical protein
MRRLRGSLAHPPQGLRLQPLHSNTDLTEPSERMRRTHAPEIRGNALALRPSSAGDKCELSQRQRAASSLIVQLFTASKRSMLLSLHRMLSSLFATTMTP